MSKYAKNHFKKNINSQASLKTSSEAEKYLLELRVRSLDFGEAHPDPEFEPCGLVSYTARKEVFALFSPVLSRYFSSSKLKLKS